MEFMACSSQLRSTTLRKTTSVMLQGLAVAWLECMDASCEWFNWAGRVARSWFEVQKIKKSSIENWWSANAENHQRPFANGAWICRLLSNFLELLNSREPYDMHLNAPLPVYIHTHRGMYTRNCANNYRHCHIIFILARMRKDQTLVPAP